MGQITFVEHDGTTHQVDLEADKNANAAGQRQLRSWH